MQPRTAGLILGIPASFALAGMAMRALLARAPAHVAADLAQPLAVVTNWSAFGASMLALLAAAVIAGTLLYLFARSSDGLTLAGVLGGSALALLAAWTLPLLFSSDVYAYAAYGELARLGADPYAHRALPASTPVFAAAIWQWGNPPPMCVYGPLFVAVASAAVTFAAPLGVTMQLDALRLLASAALLACAALAYAAYRGDVRARTLAAATIALNPVAIWSAAEGHNDAFAVAVVLLGFALMRRRLHVLGGLVAALAGAIKLPALAAAAVAGIRDARVRYGAIAGTLAALALCAPLFAAATERLAPQGRYAPEASLQAIVKPLALLVLSSDSAAAALTLAVAAIPALLLAVPAIRALRRDDAEGWVLLALAAWLLVPNPYPWYATWLLPVAALAPGSRASLVLLAVATGSLLRYVPDAVGAPSTVGAVVMGVAATLPYLLLALPRRGSAIMTDPP